MSRSKQLQTCTTCKMKDVNQQQHLSPLIVQSSKINGWLISRNLIQRDYPKKLREIECKIDDIINKNSDISIQISESSSLYLGCRDILDILTQTDNKTDFFGRSSPLVRAWSEIVSLFQKNNLFFAEVGDAINELSAVQVPRCKLFIAERQKHLLSLHQKLREQNLNLSHKEELLEKVYKEFRFDTEEKNVKLRLLEEAENVPKLLADFVRSLAALDTALKLYNSFKTFVVGGFQDNNKPEKKSFECCPTLQLLINSGHVLVFTWKNGYKPEHVKESDDFIPLLLQHERTRLKQSSIEIKKSELAESPPSEPNEIVWDETEAEEIGFGPFDLNTEESIEIEMEDALPNSSLKVTDVPNSKPIVASGASARYLLDSADGRKALLNDLLELGAFLQRFQEDLLERLDNEGGNQLGGTGRNTTGPSGCSGCDALQNMIMQEQERDALSYWSCFCGQFVDCIGGKLYLFSGLKKYVQCPQNIQSYTYDEISKMIGLVKEAQKNLTTSSLSQLMMIRSRTGYLDRLTDRLMDYRRQVELAKTRVCQTQQLIDKAIKEQEEKTTQLIHYKQSCKKLVSFLEDELSRDL
ncbi:unnamed protein product [Heterobilharzia americana]|nr:unnamed protein product [Heterobilharzia americana]